MIDTEIFRAAMSRMVGCVAVVATMRDNTPAGIVATSVCSLSDNPPSLIVCINKSSSAYLPMSGAQRFSVNLLATDQSDVVEQFRAKDGAARFHPDKWMSSRRGVPILKGAVVSFDCDIEAEFDGHTHSIVSSIIRHIALDDTGKRDCLLWADRKFGRRQSL